MIDEAVSLYKRCFPEEADRTTEVVFSRRLDFADRREKRVGDKLVSVLWLVDKPLYFCGKDLTVPHVVGLCTDPEERNKGYAKALLSETIASLRGAPFLTLYPFSHAFYEKMGFCTVSYDDQPPQGRAETSADASLLTALYADFCRDLDYYFFRREEDFSFYKDVNAPCGENYALLDGGKRGFRSPDEYLPASFSDLKGEKKGVMARICDVETAMRLLPIDLDPVRVVDPLGVEKRAFRCRAGEVEFLSDGRPISPQELLQRVFEGKKGYLLDRY